MRSWQGGVLAGRPRCPLPAGRPPWRGHGPPSTGSRRPSGRAGRSREGSESLSRTATVKVPVWRAKREVSRSHALQQSKSVSGEPRGK